MMKQVFVLLAIVIGLAYCTKSADEKAGLPIQSGLVGKWKLTQEQEPGTGTVGAWFIANPVNRSFEISPDGSVRGTAFPDAKSVQELGNSVLKITDPGVQAGYRLFSYQMDTVTRILFLYIQPTNGSVCNEGCGGYRFERLE